MKSYKSWTISDEYWEEIKCYLPDHKRDPNRVYKCKPGRGRPALPKRQVLEGILYVLRNGCLWKAVPREYGASSSIHRYFQEWVQAGVFEKLWEAGLLKYDDLKGIGWEWQSIDGCMVKAPLAQEAVGRNPTDRGKKRNKAKSAD